MTEFFAYLFKYFPYIAAVVTTVFALRVAWDAFKSGASPLSAIGRGLGMIITFFFLINALPYMFESGVASAYQRYQSGTVGKNLVAIGQGGVNLLVSARADATDLDVPEAEPLAEFAADTLEKLKGSGNGQSQESAPGGGNQSANSEPSSLVTLAGDAPQARLADDPGQTQIQSAADAINAVQWLAPTPTARPVTTYRELKQQQSGANPLAQPTMTGQEYINKFLQEQGVNGEGGGPATYIVQRGDNIGRIARRLGVDAGALCRANLSVVRNNCDLLRAGMVLAIP